MKVFCENCYDMVEFNVKRDNKNKNIKGKTIEYIGKTAFCKECQEEIFVSEIRDYNLEVFDTAFRKAEGLIFVSEIEQILEKYNVGKRPLSLLLGWGEGTVTRYIDGDIPTKPYSDILKMILKDEDYFCRLLEQNKGNISVAAYRKIISAIKAGKEKNQNTLADNAKIESAAKYLLIRASEITPLALQKLLYFSQGFHKAFTGEYLFEDDCEAWVHGPVYRNIYEKYKEYGYNPIEKKKIEFDHNLLIENEKNLLEHIVHCFGCYSGKVLEDMTHTEEPWRIARRGLSAWENSERIISKESISTYFEKVKAKYRMLNLADIKDYTTNLFSKLYV